MHKCKNCGQRTVGSKEHCRSCRAALGIEEDD